MKGLSFTILTIIFNTLYSVIQGCDSSCNTCYEELKINCKTCPTPTATIFDTFLDFVYDIKVNNKGSHCVNCDSTSQYSKVKITMKDGTTYHLCFWDGTIYNYT